MVKRSKQSEVSDIDLSDKITMKLHHKLFLTFVLIIASTFTGVSIYLDRSLNDKNMIQLRETIKKHTLASSLILSKQGTKTSSIEKMTRQLGQTLNLRVTVISSDGKVFADSEIDNTGLSKMDNHLVRPEIQAAIKNGEGWSQRFSATLKKDIMYYAVPSKFDGFNGFIRLAIPVEKVNLIAHNTEMFLWFSLLIAFIVSLLAALIAFNLISKPIRELAQKANQIAAGDFSTKLVVNKKDEVGELANSLNIMSENIRNTITELRKLEMIRKDFVANVSHELRTPISNIKGYAETLLDGAIDDTKHAKDFIKIIYEESDRLAYLINDILDLSKTESDTFKLSLKQNNLFEIVNESIKKLEKEASNKSISIKNELKRDMCAISDKGLLTQVFINLIHNAIKYSHDNSDIIVSSSTTNNFIKIEVKDFGIGIPEQDLSRIFERFYRVDKARSKDLGGTGLGLAIVKHTVQAHGGDVFVKSIEGQGSTFGFTIPYITSL